MSEFYSSSNQKCRKKSHFQKSTEILKISFTTIPRMQNRITESSRSLLVTEVPIVGKLKSKSLVFIAMQYAFTLLKVNSRGLYHFYFEREG